MKMPNLRKNLKTKQSFKNTKKKSKIKTLRPHALSAKSIVSKNQTIG